MKINTTVEVTTEADVEIDAKEFIEALSDDEMTELGIRHVGTSDGYDNVLTAVRDWHRDHHEAQLITACNEDVCAEINYAGSDAIGML